MQPKLLNPFFSFVLLLTLVSLACATAQPAATQTSTPQPTATSTATITPIPTKTLQPTATPRPTKTPNLAATQRADELNAEAKAFFDKGYLAQPDGKFTELEDFSYDWPQMGWYNWL